MSPTRFLVGRPLLTTMVFCAISLLGAYAAFRLPVSELPKIDVPYIVIQTDYGSASAATVKRDVTDNIEKAINQLGSVEQLTGTSSTGLSTVVVELQADTSVDTAAADISQAVNRASRRMPDGVGTPAITKIDPSAAPVYTVSFTGSDTQTLSNVLADQIVPQLQLVEGVGQVSILGQRRTVTEVVLSADRLNARGLTVPAVVQALTTKNVTLPGGATTSGNGETQVRLTSQATTNEQLGGIVVGTSGGAEVHLRDVATLHDAPEKATNASLLDGKPSVALQITSKSGSNVIDTVDGVKAALAKLGPALPSGVRLVTTTDTTVFTFASVRATVADLVLAILLASLVILLFLQSWRQTLVVLVAIPTSLLATTMMMQFLDFSLDTMSLLAMSLLIGILVDDAVVVLENITRHLGMGKDRVDAAVDGRLEIGGAAIALTLTDVVVFMPLAVAPGFIGDLFIELGLTIVIATLFSLVVSFTLTPMLAARWLKPPGEQQSPPHPVAVLMERGMNWVEHTYVRLLRGTLRHRPTVVFVGLACFLVSVGMFVSGRIGTTLSPELDSNRLAATVTMPTGTSLAAATRNMTTLSGRLKSQIPDVTSVYASVGSVNGFSFGASTGTITINLKGKDRRSADLDTLKKRVNDEVRRMPGMRATVYAPSAFASNGASGLPVQLSGPDQSKVQQYATEATRILAKRPELANVTSTATQLVPTWDVTLDQVTAAKFGVTPQQVAATIAAATDGSDAGSIRTNAGTDQTVHVTLAMSGGGESIGEAQLRDLPITVLAGTSAGTGGGSSGGAASGGAASGGAASGGAAGASSGSSSAASPSGPTVLTLGQVATVKRGSAPQSISDVSQQPEATITLTASAGHTTGDAQKAIGEVMTAMKLPVGYTYDIGGAARVQSDAFLPLMVSILLAPILIYMVLAALYESLVLPFAVQLAMPLAMVGALVALALTRSTLNLFSLIGLVMLLGLVSKNAILLVDRAEVQRARGLSVTDALVEAGRTRLRPILMTTMTLVIAMMPIALIEAPGSEQRTPIAWVLIGGMTSSTLLTLLVVPTLYTLLDAGRERLPSALRGLARGRVPGLTRWLRGREGARELPPVVSDGPPPPPTVLQPAPHPPIAEEGAATVLQPPPSPPPSAQHPAPPAAPWAPPAAPPADRDGDGRSWFESAPPPRGNGRRRSPDTDPEGLDLPTRPVEQGASDDARPDDGPVQEPPGGYPRRP